MNTKWLALFIPGLGMKMWLKFSVLSHLFLDEDLVASE